MTKENLNDLFKDEDNLFGKPQNAEYTIEDKNNNKNKIIASKKTEPNVSVKQSKDQKPEAEENVKQDVVADSMISEDNSVKQEMPTAQNEASTSTSIVNAPVSEVIDFNAKESKIVLNFIDDNNHTTHVKLLSGYVGHRSNFNLKQGLNSWYNRGYELSDLDYQLPDLIFTDKQQTYGLHLKHRQKDISRSKQIKQTVEYSMSDNSTAPEKSVQVLTLTQNGTYDYVTKHKQWNKNPIIGQFPLVKIPKVNGYTPDSKDIKQSVTLTTDNFDDDLDLYNVVNFVIDNQNIILKIIDKTTGKEIIKEYHGVTNQKTTITTQKLIAQREKEHYELIVDETYGRPLVYDDITGNDQVYLIEFKHKIQELTLDNPINPLSNKSYQAELKRILTRTIEFVIPNNHHEPVEQNAEFERKGYLDLVTGKIEYSKWTPDRVYPEYRVPNLIGYAHSVEAVPAKKVDVNGKNEKITIDYKALKQSLKLIFYDQTLDITINEIKLTGHTNEKPDYNFKAAIKALEDSGYLVENQDWDTVKYDPAKDNQEYRINLRHNTQKITVAQPINPTNEQDLSDKLTLTVKRTIDFIVPNEVEKPTTIVQSLSFNREGVVDLTNGGVKFLAWQGKTDYPEVQTPIIPGYEADALQIAKRNSEYKNSNVTVEYTPRLQTFHLIFKDTVTGNVLSDKELSGHTYEPIDSDVKPIIKKYAQDGYELINDGFNNLKRVPAQPKKQYQILLGHGKTTVDIDHRINPVTQHDMLTALTKKELYTIKYQIYRSGMVAAPDYEYSYLFHRTAVIDLVTGNPTYSDWKEDKALPIVPNPEIKDYDSLADLPDSQINQGVDLKTAKSNIIFVKYYPKAQNLIIKFVDQDNKEIKQIKETVTFKPTHHEYDLQNDIDKLLNIGYGIDPKSYPKTISYDPKQDETRHYTYRFYETHTVKTNAKNIVRRIVIESPNKDVRAISQISRITQKVEISNVTKKEIKGKWTRNVWDSFTPANIKGYEPSIPKIEQKLVDYDTQAELVKVHYIKPDHQLAHHSEPKMLASKQKVQSVKTQKTEPVKTQQIKSASQSKPAVAPKKSVNSKAVKKPVQSTMPQFNHHFDLNEPTEDEIQKIKPQKKAEKKHIEEQAKIDKKPEQKRGFWSQFKKIFK